MAVVAACFQPSAGSSTVTLAFFARRPALILLSGALSLKEAYDSIEWPILILLGAFIPVSEALRSTGATDLVAGSSVAMTLPPIGALTMMLVAAMAITPFLNTPPRRSSSPRSGLSTDRLRALPRSRGRMARILHKLRQTPDRGPIMKLDILFALPGPQHAIQGNKLLVVAAATEHEDSSYLTGVIADVAETALDAGAYRAVHKVTLELDDSLVLELVRSNSAEKASVTPQARVHISMLN